MPLSLAMYILGFSAAGWSFVALYAQYQRRVLGVVTQPVILLALTIFEWTIFYAVEIAIADPQLKIAAHHLKYIGMCILPLSGLLFTVAYTDPSHGLTRRQRTLAIAIPSFVVLAALTNSYHHLMWTDLQVVRSGEFEVVQETRGIVAWIQTVYAYTLLIIIIGNMFRHWRKPATMFPSRYLILLFALMFPGIASLPTVSQALPIDYTPFALTLSGITISWSLFSYRLIDLAPLARNIVTESMTDGMIVLDAEGKVVSANPAAREILGGPDVPLIGKTYAALMYDLMQRGAEDDGYNRQTTGEIKTLVNGDTRYLELRVSPLQEDTPVPVGRVVVVRDITRRKETESRLKAALDAEKELNALRAHFVSIVSHEFRTPMSIIQTATEMMRLYRDRMDAKALDDKFDTITAQIALMNALIDDVLSLDRLQTGTMRYSPETLPAVETIRELLDEMRQDKQVASRIEFEPSEPGVILALDKKLIRLVIRNLVGNALKYSPDGQPVTVTLYVEGETLQLRVIDRGIGIPEEDQARLFDPFYRAANVGDVPGSGLGLMIVKQAVDLHSGKIHFTSSSSGGTTFSVLLPLSAPSSEAETYLET